MKIRVFFVIVITSLTSIVFAQNDKYISFEIAGSGGFGSFNYEKLFLNKEPMELYMRLGLSILPIDKNNGSVLIFPLMVHGVFGETSHKLDLGIGQSISITTRGSAFILMPLSCGYRFQPALKYYYLRVAYTPLFSYLVDLQWQHWLGLSFGYKLK